MYLTYGVSPFMRQRIRQRYTLRSLVCEAGLSCRVCARP
jgi:hypothetical protein